MAGGNKNIKPEDGRQFSSDYQPQEKWTEQKALVLAEEMIEWLKEKDEKEHDKGNIFFEEFLVIEKDLYPQLISYLENKFSSFFKLIEKAKKIQELKLVKYGVGDRLNATMTKFVLSNHHGYSDKNDLTTNGKDLTNNEVDYKRLSDKALEEIASQEEEDNN